MGRAKQAVVTVVAALVALAVPILPVAASNDVSHKRLVNANPSDGTPDVLDGEVDTMDRVGDTMVVGGTFTQVQLGGGTILDRDFIFAFDVKTGAISTTFVPELDGSVESIESAGDGRNVFVGGFFATVNGHAQRLVTKLNVETGHRVAAFAATVDEGPRVLDMALVGKRLFLGGAFSKVDGVARSKLAAVNASTGDLVPGVRFTFAGTQHGGAVKVHRFDVSPDGRSLVAVGNFLTVDGQSRVQIAKFNIGANPATLSSWSTKAFVPQCNPSFDTYMRDVDIAPSGTYFVVATTGAYEGGPDAGVYCDSITRWEMNRSGGNQEPTWRDYPGGDTSTSVLSTGEAVYVGGHFRWLNNPFAGDAAGPGAVTREGIAALDPSNGLPLDWDPGRDPRGEGVWKLIAFTSSLWFGSDTCCVAGETHQRIAGFPIAGGKNVAPPTKVALPSFLYRLPQASGAPGRRLIKRRVTSTKIGSASAVATPGVDWSTARGAFFTNGWIYTGQSDGSFTRRTFDGTSVGTEEIVNLNGLDASRFPVSDVTGMFLHDGFLYYTVAGDAHLFSRYFTPQTAIVGAETFVVRSGGVDWSGVQGMALAGNRLYFVRANGNLARVDFRGGGPVSGTERLVNRKVDWSSRGLFFRD